MLKYISLCCVLVFNALTLHAQLEKILHHTFVLDSVDLVMLDVAGEIVIEPWAGNAIMTETHIKIYDSSKGIIDYFVKAGRYDVIAESEQDKQLTLLSKDKIRRPIRTKSGVCHEEVVIRIFIPEEFEAEGANMLKRITPIEEETPQTTAPQSTPNTESQDSSFLTPAQVDSTFVNGRLR
ncbi:MAG: hypothetical protein AAGK47_08215 [Bacteroidota bacterium]